MPERVGPVVQGPGSLRKLSVASLRHCAIDVSLLLLIFFCWVWEMSLFFLGRRLFSLSSKT